MNAPSGSNPIGGSTLPLVSVLMITYNHRTFIEAAVNSVLGQRTDFVFELLLADDCSKDGTREFVMDCSRRYPDRVRLIISDHNVGMHANLLRAERASQGRYVAYCEGDDFWNDPTKLARQVAFLEARPDYSMVHSHCHRYFVEQRRLLRNALRVPQDLDDSRAYEDMLRGVRYPLTVTVTARRETLFRVLDECPECTDPKWPMGDTQRWLELARRGKVGCIHEPLATTNILAESAGQSRDSSKRLRFLLAARDLQLHYLRKYPVSEEAERASRRHLAGQLLHAAFVAQDASVAGQMYAELTLNGNRPGIVPRWLLWGSQSRLRYRLVQPCVRSFFRWDRMKRRLASAILK